MGNNDFAIGWILGMASICLMMCGLMGTLEFEGILKVIGGLMFMIGAGILGGCAGLVLSNNEEDKQ